MPIPINQPGSADSGASLGGAGGFLDFDSGLLDSLLGSVGAKKSDVDNLTEAALGTQLGFGSQIADLFQTYGMGQKAAVEQGFKTQFNNILGRLEQRGLGGSSLEGSALLGLEREKQLTLGQLEDQLLGRNIDFLSGLGGSISDIFSGAADRRLQEQLLKKQLEAEQGLTGGPLRKV